MCASPIAPPLLVFDLDGTLADTAPDLIATLNVVLEAEGCAPVPLAVGRTFVGRGGRVMIERGLAASGHQVSPARLEEIFDAFLAHYEAHIADASRLYPGVGAALDRFEAAGWAFAVCTNKLEHPARLLLTALGLADRFRCICGQNTFAVAKPNAEALLKTVEKAGGTPQHAIMIGDSKTDIETAQNAHIPIVAVDFGYTERPVHDFGPDRVISHFDELWDAVLGLQATA
jgi:phosphoglycolate phosphatase